MGCVASSEDDGAMAQPLTLAEREAQARFNRKRANLVHNMVHEKFGSDIREFYDIDDEVLGEGIQGVVRTAVNKKTGIKFAVKTVPIGAGKNSMAMGQLRSELDLIRRLDHPNIVRLQEVFETEDSLFLVMDLCTGGDMMSRWERNRRLRYSEDDAALTVKKILNAVRYCHKQQVVHRDIKLENLLWEHPGDDAEPQLVDFGLGVKFSEEDEKFHQDVGSLYYVAPEVLGRSYTKACDCWSIGVIAYMLLAGMPPFMAPTDEGVKLKIKWARVPFPKEMWDKVSDEAKDFVKKMLMKAPSKRMSADQACAHPWITKHRPRQSAPAKDLEPIPQAQTMAERDVEGEAGGDVKGQSTPLDPELVRRLRNFADFGKLKRVAFGVIAHSLTPEEIRALRIEFQAVDVEGRGEISPMDLQKALNKSDNYTKEEVEKLFEQIDLDQDGTIGFTEFVAASLHEGHVKKDENLRLAFDRLDADDTGKITLDNLLEFIGASSDELTIGAEITDETLYEALIEKKEDGLSYDVFRKAMVKNFSSSDLSSPTMFSNLVRAASKLSIDELARVTGGSTEDADTIITASQAILQGGGRGSDAPQDSQQHKAEAAANGARDEVGDPAVSDDPRPSVASAASLEGDGVICGSSVEGFLVHAAALATEGWRRVARLLGAAAALRYTASSTAATAAAAASTAATDDPEEPAAASGRGLVGAATYQPQQGPSRYKGRSAYGFFDDQEHCTESPLWDKEVDAASYELGCKEIEAMLESNPRFVGEGRVRRVTVVEHEGRTLAIKELKDRGNLRLHRLEVVTMDVVRGNPYVVQMLGMCNTTVVTEAFAMDIQSAMKKRTGTLPIRSAVSMSLDSARGLQALHEASIVHYDIKPAQMLVTGDEVPGGELRVKLNDFNVVFFMSSMPDGTPCPFTVRGELQLGPWRTPEYLAKKPMTEKVDIYRMGMVFKKYLANGGVHFVGHDGGAGDFDATEHSRYNTVVHDMIEEDPSRRPSARQVVERLEEILQDLP
eukprot:g5740.t1